MKPLEFEQLYPAAIQLITATNGPYARSGHRIVTDGRFIYCFGGYNPAIVTLGIAEDPMLRELWKYNISSRMWTRVQTTGTLPDVSASHTALLLGSKLLVFGGTGFPFADVKSNKLYQCDVNTNVWSIVECSGDLPGEIYGHAMIAVKNFVYIYGGTTGFVYSNTVHRLDLESRVWEAIVTPGVIGEQVPRPSYRHEIASDGEKLYIFGGGTTTTEESMKKIWILDLKKLRWEQHMTLRDPREGYPVKRKCHSCVNWKGKVFLCGGLSHQQHFDDMWNFDLKTMQWTKMWTRLPSPVYFHSAALSSNGCMYLFGGVLTIDHQVRSDALHCIWLTIPKLSELAWYVVSAGLKGTASKENLLRAGVPPHFASRHCYDNQVTGRS